MWIWLFTATKAGAQVWCPQGAEWWFEHSGIQGYQTGYMHLSYGGDTLLAGEIGKRLDTYVTGYDQLAQAPYYHQQGPVVTRSVAGAVFYWDDDQWRLSFDLSSVPGDSWILAGYGFNDRTVFVDDTGHVEVSGIPLRYATVTVDPPLFGGLTTDTVFERVGYRSLFIDPDRTLSLEADIPRLRCYADPDVSYTSGTSPSCDFVTGLPSIEHESSVTVSFDPHSVRLMVHDPQGLARTLAVHDAMGRLVVLSTANDAISLEALASGHYATRVLDRAGRMLQTFRFNRP